MTRVDGHELVPGMECELCRKPITTEHAEYVGDDGTGSGWVHTHCYYNADKLREQIESLTVGIDLMQEIKQTWEEKLVVLLATADDMRD